ncbi:outer membrane protein assembly factor BamE [Vreelandella malpeensis]|uniref:Outer membrane protein assembly factor BamE n=1 Tax=Vreelandella malpeensis TaxID=1172368 RepID=A0ABS8DSC3_9GAMM|nr:outer membrane protein assembly factor BamE [Halomonas malpeensis]MCB8889144.1 outer membrane protein assembly factor BamE [Halomonas malpeensis]
MQKLTRIITLSVALTVVSGCSYVGVYKRDIPQGNLVTQEMVSQLQPGMTQEQVTYVMGRPLLEAPFDSREWDYVYRLDKAYAGVEQRRVTLTFDDAGRLVNVEQQGDLSRAPSISTDRGVGPATEFDDPAMPLLTPSRPADTQPTPSNAPAATPDNAPEPQPVLLSE